MFRFMTQILQGEKTALKKQQVIDVKVRGYRKLRPSNILQIILTQPVTERHLPDKSAKVYRCDTTFLLSIINDIEPDYFKIIVEKAHDVRLEP